MVLLCLLCIYVKFYKLYLLFWKKKTYYCRILQIQTIRDEFKLFDKLLRFCKNTISVQCQQTSYVLTTDGICIFYCADIQTKALSLGSTYITSRTTEITYFSALNHELVEFTIFHKVCIVIGLKIFVVEKKMGIYNEWILLCWYKT